MYDPDRMPDPICGELETDHMDEQIPWMNQIIWAEDIRNPQARILKARYYGEISYIDDCIGRILDAVDAGPDANNTLICFFSDHGDHLGDHHAWQKESFFEASCHIPFLLSWPDRLPAGLARQELVCLTDLFSIATHAADAVEVREGRDVLGMLAGTAAPRDCLVGCYGDPGTPLFKVMVREGAWKYIFLANGGGEQLFNLENDPDEQVNCVHVEADTVSHLRSRAAAACDIPGARQALDENGLKAFPYRERRRDRIYQFDQSRDITGFPKKPEDVLKGWSTK